MTSSIITAQGITINGATYQAEYSKNPKGTVFAFVQLDGKGTRIKFEQNNAHYADALAAWEASYAGASAPVQVSEQAQEPSQAQEPAQEQEPASTEPSEKVEKVWVGTSIKGKGWEIYFDGGYDRTRVIFKRKPSPKVIETVKAAGFFWSPAMKSWNKKLTYKAFRAAQALAMELRTVCA